jgi:hypothetical protein
MLLHLLYLVVMATAGVWIASRRLQRRLQP